MENKYLVKYYKLSYINDLRLNNIKQGFEIKTKKVIIDDDETLNNLKDLCDNFTSKPTYKFNFKTKEDNETYLECNPKCCDRKFHFILTDEEKDDILGICYDDILVIDYKKI